MKQVIVKFLRLLLTPDQTQEQALLRKITAPLHANLFSVMKPFSSLLFLVQGPKVTDTVTKDLPVAP